MDTLTAQEQTDLVQRRGCTCLDHQSPCSVAEDILDSGPGGHRHLADHRTAGSDDIDCLGVACRHGPFGCSLASAGAVEVVGELVEQLMADRQRL